MRNSDDSFIGKIEYSDDYIVKGWALDKSCPNEPVSVLIKRNKTIIDVFKPSYYRWDLKEKGYGAGYHGFIYRISPEYLDGAGHELGFVFEKTGRELAGSPVTINTLSEKKFIPFETVDLTNRKVLVIAPHPDDECFGCGGSLVLHTNSGDPVKVIFLTDGSRADFAGKHRKEDYIRLREEEARKACEILGVSDIEFWGLPDRGLEPDSRNIDRLADVLNNYKPGLIYVPSPFEFHPDHRAAAEIVWSSVQKADVDCEVAFCEINTAIRVNTLVDISSVIELKKKASESYNSQMENIPYSDIALSLNRFRSLSVSSHSAYAEGFFLMKSEEVRNSDISKFSRVQFLSAHNQPREDSPLVSVIVRTKNRALLIRDALSSVTLQTYPNIEAVVVNDGGESVLEVVKEFRRYIPVTYVELDREKGRSAAANEGVRAAGGKYINFLDDDDLFHAGHIAKLAKYLETTGEKAAYSDCAIARYKWEGEEFSLEGERKPFRGVDHDLDHLHVFNYIPNMTLMFAKELIEKVGYLDEELDIYEDWDFWLRIAAHTYIQRLPGITAEYRVFAEHGYDYNEWRFKIYDKHKDYFQTGNYETWFIKRIDKVYEENRDLRRLLAEKNGGTNPQNFSRQNYFMWVIYKTLRKVLPNKIFRMLSR